MVYTMKTLLTHRKCLNDFRVIPGKAKKDMKPRASKFDHKISGKTTR